MKRALVVAAAGVALGAMLLTGCQSGASKASGTQRVNPAGNSSVAGSGANGVNGGNGSAGTGGTTSKNGTTTGSVDTSIDSVDNLLGQLDDQANKANQPPPDKD